MTLQTEHLHRCIQTLEQALLRLHQAEIDSIEYDIFRNAAVKGFELTLETSGKLLRKKLKTFFTLPKEVDTMTFKDVLRHASKHGLLDTNEVKRWFKYRENRNSTAHDYGSGFADETLKLLSEFIHDVHQLEQRL